MKTLKATQKIFQNTRIFPCYFHLVRRISIHIKNLKSKKNVIKRKAKNLLLNMKILFFIDDDKIDSFFSLIKKNFYNSNKNFFKYFENNYMKNKLLKSRQ